MRKLIVVSLAVLTIVGTVQFAGRAITTKTLIADGTDPMPLCRTHCPVPPPFAPVN